MSTDAAVVGAASATRWPQLVVASVTAKRVVRSALVWAAVFAFYLAASALGYAGTYKTPEQRAALARTFGNNVGVNAMIGTAHRIDTTAGFTAWRSLGILGVLGAVWGLLTATRLLRGEEDAGRWELLLAGRTTRRAAAAQALAGLAAGLAVLYAVPAAVLTVAGRSSDVGFAASAALFDVLVVTSSAVAFAAIGAATAQLAPTRRRAAGYAAAVLGVAYGLRMIADSGTSLDWLRWTTPLGWLEEARPLTGSRPLALLPMAGLIVLGCAATIRLAGRRDLGASVLPDNASAPARTALLGGPGGLAVRLVRPTLVAWCLGVGLGAFMMGLISKSAGEALASASGIHQALERLGARGVGARAYLGIVYLILAVLIAVIAAGQATAMREEEAEGRAGNLLVRRTSRSSWLLGRAGIALAAVAVAGVVAGLATWLGAATQGTGIGIGTLLAAGVNVVPAAVVVLGVGVLAFGLLPRLVTGATYAVIAWSFLVELLGGLIKADHRVLDTSLFHHMTPSPAVSPNWSADAVLLAVGLAAAAVGYAGFLRRDLEGE
jgi:polyether ionophore transport system permease protein